jgi:hypothetical protein
VALLNKRVKFIWKKLIDGYWQFFTFPAGNSMAKISDPHVSDLLAETLFHIVRCSLAKVITINERTGSRSIIKQSGAILKSLGGDWRYTLRSKRGGNPEGKHAGNNDAYMAIDGVMHVMSPLDLGDLDSNQYSMLQKQLYRDERIARKLRYRDEVSSGYYESDSTC